MPENKKSSLAVQLANPIEKLTNMNHQIKIEKEYSVPTLEEQLSVKNEKINSLTEEIHIARCIIYAKNKQIATLKESLSKSNEKLELLKQTSTAANNLIGSDKSDVDGNLANASPETVCDTETSIDQQSTSSSFKRGKRRSTCQSAKKCKYIEKKSSQTDDEDSNQDNLYSANEPPIKKSYSKKHCAIHSQFKRKFTLKKIEQANKKIWKNLSIKSKNKVTANRLSFCERVECKRLIRYFQKYVAVKYNRTTSFMSIKRAKTGYSFDLKCKKHTCNSHWYIRLNINDNQVILTRNRLCCHLWSKQKPTKTEFKLEMKLNINVFNSLKKGQLIRNHLTDVQFKEIEQLCSQLKMVIENKRMKIEHIQIIKAHDAYQIETNCRIKHCNSPINVLINVANRKGIISYFCKMHT